VNITYYKRDIICDVIDYCTMNCIMGKQYNLHRKPSWKDGEDGNGINRYINLHLMGGLGVYLMRDINTK